jgi:hypothetical protein
MSGPDGFKNRSKKKGEDLEQYLESSLQPKSVCVCIGGLPHMLLHLTQIRKQDILLRMLHAQCVILSLNMLLMQWQDVHRSVLF